MNRRVVLVPVLAALLAPLAPCVLSASASAAPACADFTVIGVAGSGEGGTAGGLGPTVDATVQAFAARARAAGKTVAIRPVAYPAVAVPNSVDQVGGFVASMNTGAANTQGDIAAVSGACPSTRVVMAGYSQGAAAVHRALQRLGDPRQVVAAALIADPDRIPGDTTHYVGTAPRAAGLGQAFAVVSGASPAPLAPALGARTVTACNTGDPVCQWTGNLSTAASGAHGSYSGVEIGSLLAAIAGV